MPKAIMTPTTAGATAPASTRRQVLGGAALAALTGGAFGAAVVLPNPGRAVSASANPDADLLAACAEFDALEAAYRATDFAAVSYSPEAIAADAEQSRIFAAQLPLVDRMVDHRAVTRAGQVARARSLAAWKPELLGNGSAEDMGECLMSAIVRDLVQGA
ncbi:MAG: hypothetical protein ACRYHQ_34315 [Janthinobacterium lividum]